MGSVERGCRTLAVGALEQPPWSLAPNWGEATNCSYRSPTTAPQKRAVLCRAIQLGEADLQLLVYRFLSGGKWFWARSGAEKSLQLWSV